MYLLNNQYQLIIEDIFILFNFLTNFPKSDESRLAAMGGELPSEDYGGLS
jgi:hypothetical protein